MVSACHKHRSVLEKMEKFLSSGIHINERKTSIKPTVIDLYSAKHISKVGQLREIIRLGQKKSALHLLSLEQHLSLSAGYLYCATGIIRCI